MIDNLQKEDCCGCRACANICPLHCIAFQMDQEGFEYPIVDKGRCSECGLCIKVCPFNDTIKLDKPKYMDVYGAWNTDDKVKFSCSSGGLFTTFAEYIISQGGIVFGAEVGENCEIRHTGTRQKESIEKFRKSKYVQSNTGWVYQEVKEYLEQGRQVLFSGTPCQIMALHKFLGKKYDNLYAIDVVCTGVSSPGVWSSYIKQIESECGSKVLDAIFRHKELDNVVLKAGDRNLTIKLIFENGTTLYQNNRQNRFFDGFLEKLFLRPSCSHCKAKNFVSGSDIQLGDFWEIEQMYPEVLPMTKDKKKIVFGVSEVFIYTDKGKKLFDAIADNIVSFPADLFLVKEVQRNTNWYLMTSSVPPRWNREAFFRDYQKDAAHVNEVMAYHIDRQNMKVLSSKKIGIWGSFRLRQMVRLVARYTKCELQFQFRNSNIYSIMADPESDISSVRFSPNPFRSQMMENDIRKEFRIHMEQYAKDVDLLVMDLLEERYSNAIWGKTIITKSEGYFESNGIQGMPLAVSFDMWADAMRKFMGLLLTYFTSSRIIVVENYLCGEFGERRSPKQAFRNQEYIKAVNAALAQRYQYIREQWPELKIISSVPQEYCYTETGHIYGCIPEHLNDTAYSYQSQQLCDVVASAAKGN